MAGQPRWTSRISHAWFAISSGEIPWLFHEVLNFHDFISFAHFPRLSMTRFFSMLFHDCGNLAITVVRQAGWKWRLRNSCGSDQCSEASATIHCWRWRQHLQATEWLATRDDDWWKNSTQINASNDNVRRLVSHWEATAKASWHSASLHSWDSIMGMLCGHTVTISIRCVMPSLPHSSKPYQQTRWPSISTALPEWTANLGESNLILTRANGKIKSESHSQKFGYHQHTHFTQIQGRSIAQVSGPKICVHLRTQRRSRSMCSLASLPTLWQQIRK